MIERLPLEFCPVMMLCLSLNCQDFLGGPHISNKWKGNEKYFRIKN